jgi:hypothetical protein
MDKRLASLRPSCIFYSYARLMLGIELTRVLMLFNLQSNINFRLLFRKLVKACRTILLIFLYDTKEGANSL